MAFCTNCGQQVADGAKFCANCGTPISQNTSNTERKTVFDGEIHKCPNCGEVLKAFETICPTCKFELRGAKGSNAVKELTEKIENATSEKQRIIIIKNFPIPNTKEDIFEFMLLASSNFDASYYATHSDIDDESDAWLSKIEQCYLKAKIVLSKDDFKKIDEIYTDIKKKNKKELIKTKHSGFINFALIILSIFFMYGIPMIAHEIPVVALLSMLSGFVLLIWTIVNMALKRKKRNRVSTVNNTKNSTKNDTKKTGFSTWTTPAKVLWVILNIYTIGVPAIIYACCKKN